MEWPHVLAFNLTLLAALAAPGPALLFSLRQSIVGGIAAGLATGLGLATVAAMWTLAALLGLNAIFAAVPVAYVVLKTGGALYLIWIAFRLWRNADAPMATAAQPGAKAFWGGVLVNLSNPKSVLFAGSVLIVIFPPDLTQSEKSFIVFNHFTVEVVVYSLFAITMSRGPARRGYLRLKSQLDRVAASVLGVLGIHLLVDR